MVPVVAVKQRWKGLPNLDRSTPVVFVSDVSMNSPPSLAFAALDIPMIYFTWPNPSDFLISVRVPYFAMESPLLLMNTTFLKQHHLTPLAFLRTFVMVSGPLLCATALSISHKRAVTSLAYQQKLRIHTPKVLKIATDQLSILDHCIIIDHHISSYIIISSISLSIKLIDHISTEFVHGPDCYVVPSKPSSWGLTWDWGFALKLGGWNIGSTTSNIIWWYGP